MMNDTICLDSCSETEEPKVNDDCISLNSDSDIYSEKVRVMRKRSVYFAKGRYHTNLLFYF